MLRKYRSFTFTRYSTMMRQVPLRGFTLNILISSCLVFTAISMVWLSYLFHHWMLTFLCRLVARFCSENTCILFWGGMLVVFWESCILSHKDLADLRNHIKFKSNSIRCNPDLNLTLAFSKSCFFFFKLAVLCNFTRV